jgi:hypothetical protein
MNAVVLAVLTALRKYFFRAAVLFFKRENESLRCEANIQSCESDGQITEFFATFADPDDLWKG